MSSLALAAEGSDEAALGSLERVYRAVLRGLYEGELLPGQRLVEPDLMRIYDVGRGTVREVFNRLSAAGIVTLVRHRGAAITMLSRREISELLDVVLVLFGLAASRAADRMITEPGVIAGLGEIAKALQAVDIEAEFKSFTRLREEFYGEVFRLAGNREVARLFPFARIHIMRLQLRGHSLAGDAVQLRDYLTIVDAIATGNPLLAQAAAENHVRHTADRISRAPETAFRAEGEI